MASDAGKDPKAKRLFVNNLDAYQGYNIARVRHLILKCFFLIREFGGVCLLRKVFIMITTTDSEIVHRN